MPPEHRAWMEAAVVMLREQRQGEPFACPVAVEIVAYWPLPKSRPAWCTRERWKDRVATLGIPYATKPDADNVAKIVLDAMVEAGILREGAALPLPWSIQQADIRSVSLPRSEAQAVSCAPRG